ncbi:hypothetical protein ACYOEI_00120 [Singulisphaera rosea]
MPSEKKDRLYTHKIKDRYSEATIRSAFESNPWKAPATIKAFRCNGQKVVMLDCVEESALFLREEMPEVYNEVEVLAESDCPCVLPKKLEKRFFQEIGTANLPLIPLKD